MVWALSLSKTDLITRFPSAVLNILVFGVLINLVKISFP